MRLFCVALAFLPTVALAVYDWGSCPEVGVVDPFDVGRYLGTWYEATKFPASFEDGLRCIKAEYSHSVGEEGKLKVNNSGLQDDDTVKVAIGQAYQPESEAGVGKLKVRFSNLMPYANYWVLKTDYRNYSVVFSCSSFKVFHLSYFWILVRDRSYATDKNLEPLIAFAKNAGVKTEYLEATNNTRCLGFQ